MKCLRLAILVLATGLSLPAQSPVTATVAGGMLVDVTAAGVTVPAAGLVNGVSNAYVTLQGTGALADDVDFTSYFAKNFNDPRWEVDFGAWADVNGAGPDFFVFEAAGNDLVTLQAWLPGGAFGQPVAVNPSIWSATGFFLAQGPNAGQQVFGIAVSVTDLLDEAGAALPLMATLKGIRINSNTIDGCSVCAVNPGGVVNVPPVADAGSDVTVALPANAAMLDGSGSFDPDSTPGGLAYEWVQTSGPSTALPVSVTTPQVALTGLVAGTYGFDLTVTDGAGATDTDSVFVFVVPPAVGGVSGDLRKWHRVTVTFPNGPATSESATPNPFLDYRLDVTFVHTATQKTCVVPGFYAADGNAAITHATAGSVWQVRFAPEEVGAWTYTANFVTGADIAVAPDPSTGLPMPGIHGASGSFVVASSNATAPDHRARGRLRYQDRHHLVFGETGEAYIKGGADSPENLLGFFGFDNTYDTGGLATPGLMNGLHHFIPHAADWSAGDPNWTDEQGDEGRNLIGALNYLGSRGGNSVYFLTYNVDGGDGRDTWMWRSTPPAPPTPAEKLRYDCSKLDQWEIAFSHMDTNGILLHFVTQETENDGVLDGGTLGTTRRLYYRELVARFAHHLAVVWNLGEENGNGPVQLDLFAQYIRDLDPYDHPITVHTNYNAINPSTGAGSPYSSLYGNSGFEATSLQGNGANYNSWARSVRAASALAGRPWVVFGDEQGPRVDDNLDNLDVLRTDSLWGNLMGGGAGVEWYFGYQGTFGDVQSEDWRQVEPLWDTTTRARRFFETHTRFPEMEPRDDLVTGFDHCLALPGQEYVLYVEQAAAGLTVDLEGLGDTFGVSWFDPRAGTAPLDLLPGSNATVTGPGVVNVGVPPSGLGEDWVCLLRNVNVERLPVGVVSGDDLVPSLALSGSPRIPSPQFAVRVAAAHQTPVVLVVNVATTNLPVGQGSLVVLPLIEASPFLQVVPADSAGEAVFPLAIPPFPGFDGVDVFIQAGFIDPTTETGAALTDAFRLRLHL